MAKKRKQKKQSLAKNIALLFLSLGILAGASILFSMVNGRSDFSYDPFHSKWKTLIAQDNKTKPSQKSEVKTQKSSANTFEYSYWDILLIQDKEEPASENNYSIQIAAFKSLQQAQKYANDLKDKTHLQCKVITKEKWSMVRWGSFSTKSTAERYRKKLSKRLQRECIVVKM
jgi:cell division septation protein DedD